MNKLTLLGSAALAASLIAGPAFAQNGNFGNNGATNGENGAGYGSYHLYPSQNGNGGSANNGGNYGGANNGASAYGMNNAGGYGGNANDMNNGAGGNNGNWNTGRSSNLGEPAIDHSQFSGNQNIGPVVSQNRYANVGYGTYAARTFFMQNDMRNGNNNAQVGGNNNWRPSQRNAVLADNGDARASKVIGTAVHNARGQEVGNVNDILIGANGVWAVISTNNKRVAVPFGTLRFGDAINDGNEKIVLPDVTQAQLDTLPAFNYNVTNYQAFQRPNNGGWFDGSWASNNNYNNNVSTGAFGYNRANNGWYDNNNNNSNAGWGGWNHGFVGGYNNNHG